MWHSLLTLGLFDRVKRGAHGCCRLCRTFGSKQQQQQQTCVSVSL
jgi:hypothetical protein